MVHQAAKLKDDEKDKYIEWLYDLEFNIYQIPKPDHIIFLDVEPEVSQELLKKKRNNFYWGKNKGYSEKEKKGFPNIFIK